MPRVSIIVPAFNTGPLIEQTLSTVVHQTFGDWEIIVADDGSTDRTADLAAGVDPRVRVVATAGRLGPAGARNTALALASGELVAFLDADDLLLPRFLEHQVAVFDRESAGDGPPVGIVACDARVRTPEGEDGPTFLERIPGEIEPLTIERLLVRNRIYVSALVPRAAGEEVGWFDPGLFGTEDHDLWIRILETGRRAVLNREVLAVYRHVPGSVSSNVARQAVNDGLTCSRALERGRLSPAQQRIAERQVKYHRVRAAVADARFNRRPGDLVRQLPAAAGVVVGNRERWGEWARALTGRRS